MSYRCTCNRPAKWVVENEVDNHRAAVCAIHLHMVAAVLGNVPLKLTAMSLWVES